MSLSSIIDNSNQPFILLQSSCAQTCIPILRCLAAHSCERLSTRCLLFSFLIPPVDLLEKRHPPENVEVYDFTADIPGYSESSGDLWEIITSAISKAAAGPLQIIIDSVDTLVANAPTLSQAYAKLLTISKHIRKRGSSSLIVHAFQPSEIVPLLLQPAFSPSISYAIAHPPALFQHIAREYLTAPPPMSDSPKFWSIFLPVSDRTHDVEGLLYGLDGEGSGSPNEIIVESVLRSRDGTVRRKNIERGFEGWIVAEAKPYPLIKLDSLKGILKITRQPEETPTDTHQTSFNLQLTEAQKGSRAQVPLPYAHEGKGPNVVSAIYYDPDSADDMDDDDPDEDLNI